MRISEYVSEASDDEPVLYVAPFGPPTDRYPEALYDDDEPHGTIPADILDEPDWDIECVLVTDDPDWVFGHYEFDPNDEGYEVVHDVWKRWR